MHTIGLLQTTKNPQSINCAGLCTLIHLFRQGIGGDGGIRTLDAGISRMLP